MREPPLALPNLALEAELGVQMPDDQLERVATLGDLARLAEEMM